MKINTNNCAYSTEGGTPEAIIHSKNMIDSYYLLDSDEYEHLPTLGHIPVLTCPRRSNGHRRLVSRDSVEDLNERFDELFLTGRIPRDDGKKATRKTYIKPKHPHQSKILVNRQKPMIKKIPRRFYQRIFKSCRSVHIAELGNNVVL